MRKLVVLGRFSAATAATVATKLKKLVATLFPQGSNTGSNTHCTLHWLLSQLKMPISGLSGSNGSNTFPNLSESNDFPDSWMLGDEYDYSDYGAFLDEREEPSDDYDDQWDWGDEWDEEPLDVVEELKSWSQRAVDEAIEEEKDDSYRSYFDRTGGDIPF